ncbi:MAG: FG-GAP repeat protein [Flavobacteriales bacterium]|nr:FG-GAP repeat protein [Flavobacteriales bacterium]
MKADFGWWKEVPPASGPTQKESTTVGANMGWSVAGGGDVNGDGYSDIIGGAPSASPTLASEGGFYVFNGNQARSRDRRTRQYLPDLVSPLSTNSNDFANVLFFGIGHLTRSHIQRSRARLRWEVVFEGQPFSGADHQQCVVSGHRPAWTDHGVGGVEIEELVSKVPSHLRYKWRVRESTP